MSKGDFDVAEELINKCRKNGLLPIDICAEDGSRGYDHLEYLDHDNPDTFLKEMALAAREQIENYTPVSFWNDKHFYLEMWTEKIDLKSLFSPICRKFCIPLANCKGWSDLNMRAALMRRFKAHEEAGRQCVLLYCGDFDPMGLVISDYIKSNLAELTGATGWSPEDLIIDRFGLNFDFIEEQRLTWIDNLITGSKKNLADPNHPDHYKPYVQDYIRTYGVRKVEANALVTRPEAGRELCRQAILKYLDDDATDDYQERLKSHRERLFDKHFDYLEVKYEPCCRDCCAFVSLSAGTTWCVHDTPAEPCEADDCCDEFILYKGAADDD